MSDWKLALGASALALMAGAADAADQPTVVLLHGAFETAAVWSNVQAKLTADGYANIAIDLPGRDGIAVHASGASLDLYRDVVLAKIASAPGPVVLVGHSFGGVTISAVAEAAPEKIATLVYVAAYLPTNGQSLFALSQMDKDSKMGPAFRVSDDKSMASVDPASRAALFCNDCPADVAKSVADGIVSEPLAPLATPVAVTAERFGEVDKVYIHTARDQVISPSLQDAMVKATPVRATFTLDTGHAPFAAAPEALADAIEKGMRR